MGKEHILRKNIFFSISQMTFLRTFCYFFFPFSGKIVVYCNETSIYFDFKLLTMLFLERVSSQQSNWISVSFVNDPSKWKRTLFKIYKGWWIRIFLFVTFNQRWVICFDKLLNSARWNLKACFASLLVDLNLNFKFLPLNINLSIVTITLWILKRIFSMSDSKKAILN